MIRNSVLLSFSLRLSFNIHERMSLTQCSILFIARNASISNDRSFLNETWLTLRVVELLSVSIAVSDYPKTGFQAYVDH